MTAPRGRYPHRTDAELAVIRHAYERGAEPVHGLQARYKLAGNELYALIERHGWQKRGGWSLAKKLLTGNVKRMTPSQIARGRRIENDRRVSALYRGVAEDVAYLRQRDFIVTAERAPHTYRVGNQVCTAAQVREKAERERRLTRTAELDTPPGAITGTAGVTNGPGSGRAYSSKRARAG